MGKLLPHSPQFAKIGWQRFWPTAKNVVSGMMSKMETTCVNIEAHSVKASITIFSDSDRVFF